MALILIGARKFMPKRQLLAKDAPDDAMHRFLHWLLPSHVFKSIKKGTREWLIECNKCGHRRDLWAAGFVRSGGVGEPRNWNYCPECEQWSWNKIRKKIAQEKLEL